MGHRKKCEGLEAFNNAVVRSGVTYADIQKLETQSQMKKIRAPRTEQADGRPVYMTVAARNRMKKLDEVENESRSREVIDSNFNRGGNG